MKVKRKKQAKHLISVYRNFFGFREPFQVVIDGTFCKMSDQHNVDIKDHLGRYLQSEVECLTTRCVLKELELLGDVMFPPKMVAQRLKLHRCGHRKKPKSAVACLKSLLKENNSEKLAIATQDFELTKAAAGVPGVPLLYMYKNNVVLDKLSWATAKRVEDLSQGKTAPSDDQQETIVALKKEANIELSNVKSARKRKRRGGPNPLSCKKSKKIPQPIAQSNPDPDRTGKRKRRRRRANNVDSPKTQ